MIVPWLFGNSKNVHGKYHQRHQVEIAWWHQQWFIFGGTVFWLLLWQTLWVSNSRASAKNYPLYRAFDQISIADEECYIISAVSKISSLYQEFLRSDVIFFFFFWSIFDLKCISITWHAFDLPSKMKWFTVLFRAYTSSASGLCTFISRQMFEDGSLT